MIRKLILIQEYRFIYYISNLLYNNLEKSKKKKNFFWVFLLNGLELQLFFFLILKIYYILVLFLIYVIYI